MQISEVQNLWHVTPVKRSSHPQRIITHRWRTAALTLQFGIFGLRYWKKQMTVGSASRLVTVRYSILGCYPWMSAWQNLKSPGRHTSGHVCARLNRRENVGGTILSGKGKQTGRRNQVKHPSPLFCTSWLDAMWPAGWHPYHHALRPMTGLCSQTLNRSKPCFLKSFL